jgi:uncharacterized membrane protein YfhO
MDFAELVRGRERVVLLLLIAVISCIVFWKFLTLSNVYLFVDTGNDTINAFYPQLVHISDYLHEVGMPRWSFYQGMGQNIFPFSIRDPFFLIHYCIGREGIPYALAYIEVFKIVLAGFVFFQYLRLLGMSAITTIAGGILYSFSGFMILGSGWYGFSYEVLLAALLLYSFEKLYQQKVWYYLPIAVALLAVFQPFYLYLYGVFLCVYAVVRHYEQENSQSTNLRRLLLMVGGLFVLGMAIGGIFLLPNTLQMLQSPRVGGEESYMHRLASKPILALIDGRELASLLTRFLSNDLLGTGSRFRGWYNYMESPVLYCGLVSVLLAPQVFSIVRGRRKQIYLLLTGAMILTLVFPYFRNLFWLFTGDYYRTFGFFVVLVMLYFGLHALNSLDRASKLNVTALLITLAVGLAICFVPIAGINRLIDSNLRTLVAIFLLSNAALLFLLRSDVYKQKAQLLLLLVICVELTYFSSVTVNTRGIVHSDQLRQKIGYNDYTVDAISYLNATDSSFYRVNKAYFSTLAPGGSLNDSKIQRYRGTTSYYQFNQLYYIRFLQEMGVIAPGDEPNTRWSLGLLHSPMLRTLASVKYQLSPTPDVELESQGYRHAAQFGNVHIYQNEHYLPLGFAYNFYVHASRFAKLTPEQKTAVVYRAAVVEDSVSLSGLQPYDIATTPTAYGFTELFHDVDELRRDTLSIHYHDQNRIAGTARLDRPSVLFISIPFDQGWSAMIDGRSVKPLLVARGFMGFTLDAGEHTVELQYFPPMVKGGFILSIAGVFAYGLTFYFVTRKKRYRKPPAVSVHSQDTYPVAS